MQRPDIESRGERTKRAAFDSPKKSHRLVCLLLFSALLIFAWAASVLPEEPAGKDLGLFYQQNCTRCHGVDGSALGPDGKKLKGHDLTDERWLQNTDDNKMVHAILNGKFFGLAMPGFKDALSMDEAQRMVTDVIRKSRKGRPIGAESKEPIGE